MTATLPRQKLLAAARAVRARAHAPYSRFRVGAAVLDERGRIHAGCNVENASYGLTVCAERNAIAAAVAAGARRILAVAVVSSDAVTPCGACRQVIAQLASAATAVLMGRPGRWSPKLPSAPCSRTRSRSPPQVPLTGGPSPSSWPLTLPSPRFAGQTAATVRSLQAIQHQLLDDDDARVAVAAHHGDADVVGVALEQQVDAPVPTCRR